MAAQYDFLVIGDDEASLCAAACAARAGAKTGLAREEKKHAANDAVSIPNIPNFIWRRLDLHEYGLSLEPVSARVTINGDGKAITTFANRRETAAALKEGHKEAHLLWSDFVEDIERLARYGVLADAASGAPARGGNLLAALLGDPNTLRNAARAGGSCRDLLNDYFSDNDLKNHLCAHALSHAGLGGEEAGSALQAALMLDEEAWPVRPAPGGRPARKVLEEACKNAGVDFFDGAVTTLVNEGKYQIVFLSDDAQVKTRYLFFASPDAAAKAGALSCAPGASMTGGGTETVRVVFTLSEPVDPPAQDRKAIFQLAGGELQDARDAALSGRLPDRLPVEFEFLDNGGVVARSSYCPAAFNEDGHWRGWTGQDKQAAALRMKERLVEAMPEMAGVIKKTKVTLAGHNAEPRFKECANVIIQPDRHNVIGAAVKLIDRIMAGDV